MDSFITLVVELCQGSRDRGWSVGAAPAPPAPTGRQQMLDAAPSLRPGAWAASSPAAVALTEQE